MPSNLRKKLKATIYVETARYLDSYRLPKSQKRQEDQIRRLLLKASRITGKGYKRVNNQGRVEEIKWKEKKRKRK